MKRQALAPSALGMMGSIAIFCICAGMRSRYGRLQSSNIRSVLLEWANMFLHTAWGYVFLVQHYIIFRSVFQILLYVAPEITCKSAAIYFIISHHPLRVECFWARENRALA